MKGKKRQAKRPVPDANLLARMREGVETIGIVHFSVNTFTDREWGVGSESPDDFNPTDFSADQIVRACRDGGIQGLVVVAKHHDGFCLWPTKTTAHNVSRSKWMGGKGDVVGAMEKACRKFGLKFGVYCSPWDRNSAAYGTPEYVGIYHEQVEELNDGRYGQIFEMWFDGANGGDGYYGGAWEKRAIGVARDYYRFETLWDRVIDLQPTVCFFGGRGGFTWPGNESGVVPPESGGTRDDGTFRIYEADFPLRPGWFYHKSQDGYSRSGEFLMKVYLRTVGNGATMNIGIAPDRRGRLTDEDVGCLKRFAEIRKIFFSNPVKDASTPFNVIVMTEDIARGERVDEWRVVLDGRELARGGKIGAKRIRVLDAPVSGKRLKLEIVRGDAEPNEIKMELFAADEELVREVMSSEEPKRPPAPFERKGVLASRTGDTLVFMVKSPQETSSLLLTPDAGAPDGTPVAFRVMHSADGEEWEEDETEYRLDNIAANPIPQTVALGRTIKVKYLRLKAVRTLKDGAAVHVKGLDFIDDAVGPRVGTTPSHMNETNTCPVSAAIDRRENIEWSIFYAYHVTDDAMALPRVLLVGDSICNAYRDGVRELLKGKANVTFWASSYSATRPEYIRLLEFMLDADDYAVVHFNNGLHSLDDDTAEWAAALEKALLLVRAKRPSAKIVWTASTPLADPDKTVKVRELNAAAAAVVARLGGIGTDDLFSLLDPLDREKFWTDVFHHNPEARAMEARQVADCVLAAIA